MTSNIQPFKVPFARGKTVADDWFNFFSQYFGRLSGSTVVKHDILNLGPWDMTTDDYITIQLSSTIHPGRVFGYELKLLDDSQTTWYDARFGDGIELISTSNTGLITIVRRSPGIFDTPDFSSVANSRGALTLNYTTQSYAK